MPKCVSVEVLKWLIAAVAVAMAAPAGGELAEVIDLADANLPALELTVVARAPVAAVLDQPSERGYLTPGRRVRVLRWSAERYYVASGSAFGAIEGWVSAAALTPAPADWLAAVRAKVARVRRNRELIARHEVVVGMTREEVRASLGEPQRRSEVRTGAAGDEEWVYREERYVPQYRREPGPEGGARQSVTYVKVPRSERRIRFSRGEVAAVEEPAAVAP